VTGVTVRPATRADAGTVTELIVDTPGGLSEIVGSRGSALRIVRRTFVSSRSFFGHSHTLVAEDEGTVVGEVVRLPGSLWKRLRLRTGLTMLLASRPGEAWRLAWRGSVADRATAPIGGDVLYVVSLSVTAHRRGEGIGAVLLAKAVEEAKTAGLRAVALDVAVGNGDAIRFYRREGFTMVLERRHPRERGLPAGGSIRMERPMRG
jgi:ribosomal protein S18 acetylase RimI-like enzyme